MLKAEGANDSMNDRQLKYILTIVEAGSINAAAKQLYISQPSLSAMVADIEKKLGVKLFDRGTNPISLTYAGECYVDAARRMLDIHRDMANHIEKIRSGEAGRLSVGCTHQTSSMILPIIVPKFMQSHPGMKLRLIENRQDELEKLLSTGEADVIFSTANIENPSFERCVLSEEELILLAPEWFEPHNTFHVEGRRFPCIDVCELEDKPFVLMKRGHQLRTAADRILQAGGVEPRLIMETDNWQTSLNFVRNGMAFTVLPYSPLKKSELEGGVKVYSARDTLTRIVYIYWRRDTYQPDTVRRFVDFSVSEISAIV